MSDGGLAEMTGLDISDLAAHFGPVSALLGGGDGHPRLSIVRIGEGGSIRMPDFKDLTALSIVEILWHKQFQSFL